MQTGHNPYIGAKITNVRRGKLTAWADRRGFLYAELQAVNDETLIQATLDYIQDALRERLTTSQYEPFQVEIERLKKEHNDV